MKGIRRVDRATFVWTSWAKLHSKVGPTMSSFKPYEVDFCNGAKLDSMNLPKKIRRHGELFTYINLLFV